MRLPRPLAAPTVQDGCQQREERCASNPERDEGAKRWFARQYARKGEVKKKQERRSGKPARDGQRNVLTKRPPARGYVAQPRETDKRKGKRTEHREVRHEGSNV